MVIYKADALGIETYNRNVIILPLKGIQRRKCICSGNRIEYKPQGNKCVSESVRLLLESIKDIQALMWIHFIVWSSAPNEMSLLLCSCLLTRDACHYKHINVFHWVFQHLTKCHLTEGNEGKLFPCSSATANSWLFSPEQFGENKLVLFLNFFY